MLKEKIQMKDVIKYIQENNNEKVNGEPTDYLLEESSVSKEWYEAILEKVLKYRPKRVIDIGCCLGLFGYLFANEGIEYIGIDDNKGYNRFEKDKIKFIIDDYYNVREQFKEDIIISCLCVGYLIPVKEVIGKVLIVNSDNGNATDYKCTAKEIILSMLKEKDAEIEKLKADNTRLNKEAQKYFEITLIQSKQYSEELEKKNNIIDEMAKYIAKIDDETFCDEDKYERDIEDNVIGCDEDCQDCIKQYFERKVEE